MQQEKDIRFAEPTHMLCLYYLGVSCNSLGPHIWVLWILLC